MLKKILLILFTVTVIIAFGYVLGPKASIQELKGEYLQLPKPLTDVEFFIDQVEDTVSQLKPGNRARIVWADSVNKSKTPISIVYIHGFGASHMEGDPVHRKLAEHFGANLYLARLPEHGINRENSMEYLSADILLDAARQAYMIGKSLGDSVVVIGTSMGGALSLTLASERPEMKALVLYSPAIREYGEALDSFFKPWSKTYASRYLFEDGVKKISRGEEKAGYWSTFYHINGYESLAVLLRSKMVENTFNEIKQPVFLGYYYKSDSLQDFVVSVPKMNEMYDQLSTPDNLKVLRKFPESGDHVIASSITSKDWEGVYYETVAFLKDIVGMKPIISQQKNPLEIILQ